MSRHPLHHLESLVSRCTPDEMKSYSSIVRLIHPKIVRWSQLQRKSDTTRGEIDCSARLQLPSVHEDLMYIGPRPAIEVLLLTLNLHVEFVFACREAGAFARTHGLAKVLLLLRKHVANVRGAVPALCWPPPDIRTPERTTQKLRRNRGKALLGRFPHAGSRKRGKAHFEKEMGTHFFIVCNGCRIPRPGMPHFCPPFYHTLLVCPSSGEPRRMLRASSPREASAAYYTGERAMQTVLVKALDWTSYNKLTEKPTSPICPQIRWVH